MFFDSGVTLTCILLGRILTECNYWFSLLSSNALRDHVSQDLKSASSTMLLSYALEMQAYE
jgi:hypothetical protein